MCFCCCGRKSILIYAIVKSSFVFISSISVISMFSSSTDIYKSLLLKIQKLEDEPSSSSTSNSNNYNNRYNYYDYYDYYSYYKIKRDNSRRIDDNYYPYYTYTNYDTYSYFCILTLTKEDINKVGIDFIKSLKGIECGLGVVLFIFSLLFLVIEIIFLFFSCGIKEYKVLKDSTFRILNIIKILCITLSIIFIFLSVGYGCFLFYAYFDYVALIYHYDRCVRGIILGIAYGFYGSLNYIFLTCAFCKERTHFINVYCQSNPGSEAKYDINGNPILLNIQSNLPVQQPVSSPVYGILNNRLDNNFSSNILMNGKNNIINNRPPGNLVLNQNIIGLDNPSSSSNILKNEKNNKKLHITKTISNRKRNSKRNSKSNSKSNIKINNILENDKTIQNSEN